MRRADRAIRESPLPIVIPALLTVIVACGAPQQLRPPTASEVSAAPVAASMPATAGGHAPMLLHTTTIFAVGDLAYATAYYRDVFAWPVQTDTPTFVELALGDGSSLGLYVRDGFAKNIGKAPATLSYGDLTGTELYLVFDDPTPYLERLKARGARVLSPWSARPWGDEAAYFADPDGNVLAVARRLPEPSEK